MNNPLELEFVSDHIRIVLDGDRLVTDSEKEAFWSNLRAQCEQHHTHRVLVEGFLPTGDTAAADVVAAGMRTASVPKLWLAFHLEHFEPSERSELFKAIASSRGIHVKFFSDHDHALSWLRNNSPD
jgi:hypothetical protein